MNFTSVFEELNSLYEDKVEEAPVEEVTDEVVEDDAIAEEPAADEDPKQVILECSKCGALMIKDEADVVVDEETDLANVDEACQYCEEAEGYKIIGAMIPYNKEDASNVDTETVEESLPAAETNASSEDVTPASSVDGTSDDEDLDEGIFDFGKKKKQATTAKAKSAAENKPTKVTYSIYDENGVGQFSHTFTELPGKQSATEQLGYLLKDSYPRLWNEMKANKHRWQYTKKSIPKQHNDTEDRYNYYLTDLHFDGFLGF